MALVFIATSITWNTPAIAATEEVIASTIFSIDKFSIPAEMGTISKTYRGERGTGNGERGDNSVSRSPLAVSRNDRKVILIQDAHTVIDAQVNIRNILGHLRKTYGIRLAALEGAKGRLEPILLKTFPEPSVKRKILAGYENRAELSGPEMAAVFQEEATDFRGMEDWGLYERNYFAYLRAQEKKPALLSEWGEYKQALDIERAKVYDARLNAFEEARENFLAERTSLLDLLVYLSEFKGLFTVRHPETDVPPSAGQESGEGSQDGILRFAQNDGATPREYQELPGLIASIGYEKSGKQEALAPLVRAVADEFKSKYLRGLGVKIEMNFYNRYQAFMTGQITAGQMLQYLVQVGAEHGKTVKLTPALKKLLGHAELLSEIKGSRIYDELQRFLVEVESSLTKTAAQRAVAEQYRKLFLLREMIDLELTYEDLGKYQKEPDAYLGLIAGPGFRRDLVPALEFYQAALERDRAFMSKIDAMMKDAKQKTLTVVAGGFHTKGLERILKAKGIAYAVVTPKMASLAGINNYAKVMKGDVSFKDYLKTTYFDALMRHASKALVEALPIPDRVKTLKAWRDNVIRELAKEGRITEAGKFLPYIDELLGNYGEAVSAGPKRSKDEVLAIVRKELEKFKKDSFAKIWKTFEFQLDIFTDGLKQLIAKKDLGIQSVSALLDRASQSKPVFLNKPGYLDEQVLILPPASSGIKVSAGSLEGGAPVRPVSDISGGLMNNLPSGRSELRAVSSNESRWKRKLTHLAVLAVMSFAIVFSYVKFMGALRNAPKGDLYSLFDGVVRENVGLYVTEGSMGVFTNSFSFSPVQAGQCVAVLAYNPENPKKLFAAHFYPFDLDRNPLDEQLRRALNLFKAAGIDPKRSVFIMIRDGESEVPGFSDKLERYLRARFLNGNSQNFKRMAGITIAAKRVNDGWLVGIRTGELFGATDIQEFEILPNGTLHFRSEARVDQKVTVERWLSGVRVYRGQDLNAIARKIGSDIRNWKGEVLFAVKIEGDAITVAVTPARAWWGLVQPGHQGLAARAGFGESWRRTYWTVRLNVSTKTASFLQDMPLAPGETGRLKDAVRNFLQNVTVQIKGDPAAWRVVDESGSATGRTGRSEIRSEIQAVSQKLMHASLFKTFLMIGMLAVMPLASRAAQKMTDAQTRRIQTELVGFKLLQPKDIDGDYGKTTRGAVKELQKRLGLPPKFQTGNWGPITEAAASKAKAAQKLSASAASSKVAAQPAPETKSAATPASKIKVSTKFVERPLPVETDMGTEGRPSAIVVTKISAVAPEEEKRDVIRISKPALPVKKLPKADDPLVKSLGLSKHAGRYERLVQGFENHGIKLWAPENERDLVTLGIVADLMTRDVIEVAQAERDQAETDHGAMRMGISTVEGGKVLAKNQKGGPAASPEMIEPRSAIDAIRAAKFSKKANLQSVLFDNLAKDEAAFVKSLLTDGANNSKNRAKMWKFLQQSDFQNRVIILYLHWKLATFKLPLPSVYNLEQQAGTYQLAWAPGIFEYPRTLALFMYADKAYLILDKIARGEPVTPLDISGLRQADSFSTMVESVSTDMRRAQRNALKRDLPSAKIDMMMAEKKYVQLRSVLSKFDLVPNRDLIMLTVRNEMDRRNARIREGLTPQTREGLPELGYIRSLGLPIAMFSGPRSEVRGDVGDAELAALMLNVGGKVEWSTKGGIPRSGKVRIRPVNGAIVDASDTDIYRFLVREVDGQSRLYFQRFERDGASQKEIAGGEVHWKNKAAMFGRSHFFNGKRGGGMAGLHFGIDYGIDERGVYLDIEDMSAESLKSEANLPKDAEEDDDDIVVRTPGIAVKWEPLLGTGLEAGPEKKAAREGSDEDLDTEDEARTPATLDPAYPDRDDGTDVRAFEAQPGTLVGIRENIVSIDVPALFVAPGSGIVGIQPGYQNPVVAGEALGEIAKALQDVLADSPDYAALLSKVDNGWMLGDEFVSDCITHMVHRQYEAGYTQKDMKLRRFIANYLSDMQEYAGIAQADKVQRLAKEQEFAGKYLYFARLRIFRERPQSKLAILYDAGQGLPSWVYDPDVDPATCDPDEMMVLGLYQYGRGRAIEVEGVPVRLDPEKILLAQWKGRTFIFYVSRTHTVGDVTSHQWRHAEAYVILDSGGWLVKDRPENVDDLPPLLGGMLDRVLDSQVAEYQGEEAFLKQIKKLGLYNFMDWKEIEKIFQEPEQTIRPAWNPLSPENPQIRNARKYMQDLQKAGARDARVQTFSLGSAGEDLRLQSRLLYGNRLAVTVLVQGIPTRYVLSPAQYKKPIVVGRLSSNAIVLPGKFVDAGVSREHLEITLEDGMWWMKSKKPESKIYFNGEALKAAGVMLSAISRAEVRSVPSFAKILSYHKGIITDPRNWKRSELDKKFYAEMSQWDPEKLGTELREFFHEGLLVPINDISLLKVKRGDDFLRRFIEHLIKGSNDSLREMAGGKPGWEMGHYWNPGISPSTSILAEAIIQRSSEHKFRLLQSRYRALLIRFVEYWDELAAQKPAPSVRKTRTRWSEVRAEAEVRLALAKAAKENNKYAMADRGVAVDVRDLLKAVTDEGVRRELALQFAMIIPERRSDAERVADWYLKQWRDNKSGGMMMAFVTPAGELVAMMNLEAVTQGGTADLSWLAVQPGQQSGGIGTFMMDTCFKELAARQVKAVSFRANPAADGFYENYLVELGIHALDHARLGIKIQRGANSTDGTDFLIPVAAVESLILARPEARDKDPEALEKQDVPINSLFLLDSGAKAKTAPFIYSVAANALFFIGFNDAPGNADYFLHLSADPFIGGLGVVLGALLAVLAWHVVKNRAYYGKNTPWGWYLRHVIMDAFHGLRDRLRFVAASARLTHRSVRLYLGENEIRGVLARPRVILEILFHALTAPAFDVSPDSALGVQRGALQQRLMEIYRRSRSVFGRILLLKWMVHLGPYLDPGDEKKRFYDFYYFLKDELRNDRTPRVIVAEAMRSYEAYLRYQNEITKEQYGRFPDSIPHLPLRALDFDLLNAAAARSDSAADATAMTILRFGVEEGAGVSYQSYEPYVSGANILSHVFGVRHPVTEYDRIFVTLRDLTRHPDRRVAEKANSVKAMIDSEYQKRLEQSDTLEDFKEAYRDHYYWRQFWGESLASFDLTRHAKKLLRLLALNYPSNKYVMQWQAWDLDNPKWLVNFLIGNPIAMAGDDIASPAGAMLMDYLNGADPAEDKRVIDLLDAAFRFPDQAMQGSGIKMVVLDSAESAADRASSDDLAGARDTLARLMSSPIKGYVTLIDVIARRYAPWRYELLMRLADSRDGRNNDYPNLALDTESSLRWKFDDALRRFAQLMPDGGHKNDLLKRADGSPETDGAPRAEMRTGRSVARSEMGRDGGTVADSNRVSGSGTDRDVHWLRALAGWQREYSKITSEKKPEGLIARDRIFAELTQSFLLWLGEVPVGHVRLFHQTGSNQAVQSIRERGLDYNEGVLFTVQTVGHYDSRLMEASKESSKITHLAMKMNEADPTTWRSLMYGATAVFDVPVNDFNQMIQGPAKGTVSPQYFKAMLPERQFLWINNDDRQGAIGLSEQFSPEILRGDAAPFDHHTARPVIAALNTAGQAVTPSASSPQTVDEQARQGETGQDMSRAEARIARSESRARVLSRIARIAGESREVVFAMSRSETRGMIGETAWGGAVYRADAELVIDPATGKDIVRIKYSRTPALKKVIPDRSDVPPEALAKITRGVAQIFKGTGKNQWRIFFTAAPPITVTQSDLSGVLAEIASLPPDPRTMDLTRALMKIESERKEWGVRITRTEKGWLILYVSFGGAVKITDAEIQEESEKINDEADLEVAHRKQIPINFILEKMVIDRRPQAVRELSASKAVELKEAMHQAGGRDVVENVWVNEEGECEITFKNGETTTVKATKTEVRDAIKLFLNRQADGAAGVRAESRARANVPSELKDRMEVLTGVRGLAYDQYVYHYTDRVRTASDFVTNLRLVLEFAGRISGYVKDRPDLAGKEGDLRILNVGPSSGTAAVAALFALLGTRKKGAVTLDLVDIDRRASANTVKNFGIFFERMAAERGVTWSYDEKEQRFAFSAGEVSGTVNITTADFTGDAVGSGEAYDLAFFDSPVVQESGAVDSFTRGVRIERSVYEGIVEKLFEVLRPGGRMLVGGFAGDRARYLDPALKGRGGVNGNDIGVPAPTSIPMGERVVREILKPFRAEMRLPVRQARLGGLVDVDPVEVVGGKDVRLVVMELILRAKGRLEQIGRKFDEGQVKFMTHLAALPEEADVGFIVRAECAAQLRKDFSGVAEVIDLAELQQRLAMAPARPEDAAAGIAEMEFADAGLQLDPVLIPAKAKKIAEITAGMKGQRVVVLMKRPSNDGDAENWLRMIGGLRVEQLIVLYKHGQQISKRWGEQVQGRLATYRVGSDQDQSNKVRDIISANRNELMISLTDFLIPDEGILRFFMDPGNWGNVAMRELVPQLYQLMILIYASASKEERSAMRMNPELLLNQLNEKVNMNLKLDLRDGMVRLDLKSLADEFVSKASVESAA